MKWRGADLLHQAVTTETFGLASGAARPRHVRASRVLQLSPSASERGFCRTSPEVTEGTDVTLRGPVGEAIPAVQLIQG